MSGYCDMPAFYDEALVTARKAHKCCETKMPIAVGEKYWKIAGKWDGSIMTYRQSELGYRICRRINLDLLGECDICFGGLKEWLHDYASQSGDESVLAMMKENDWNGILTWADRRVEEKKERDRIRREEWSNRPGTFASGARTP